jgi:hypothetical protein
MFHSSSRLSKLAIFGTGVVLTASLSTGASAQVVGGRFGGVTIPTGIYGPFSGWLAPGVYQFSPGPYAFLYGAPFNPFRTTRSSIGQYAPIPTSITVGELGVIQTGVRGTRYYSFFGPQPYPGYGTPAVGGGYGTPQAGGGYGTPPAEREITPDETPARDGSRSDARPQARTASARVRLNVTPGDATVYVDGTPIGQAEQFSRPKAEVRMPAGTHASAWRSARVLAVPMYWSSR